MSLGGQPTAPVAKDGLARPFAGSQQKLKVSKKNLKLPAQ
jgi:hypothetical protein